MVRYKKIRLGIQHLTPTRHSACPACTKTRAKLADIVTQLETQSEHEQGLLFFSLLFCSLVEVNRVVSIQTNVEKESPLVKKGGKQLKNSWFLGKLHVLR